MSSPIVFSNNSYTYVVDGVLFRFCNITWEWMQVCSLKDFVTEQSFAQKCGDSKLPQLSVRYVYSRPIPVRDAPLRPSDVIEAACYRRAQALTRSKRVYKFSYGQQRLFINGVPCQGPLTRSQAKKKRVFALTKIFERRAATKEQLRLERFERLWGKNNYSFLKSLGYKKVHIAPYVPFPALPTSCKQVKNCTHKSAINCSVLGTFVARPVAIRDQELAQKLRQIIKNMRQSCVFLPTRSVSLRSVIRKVFVPRVECQMDAGPHGSDDTVSSEKVSNTVVTTHSEESKGASDVTVLNWHQLTTTDPEQEYTFGTERWSIYDVIEWSGNSFICPGSNSKENICKFNIPSDLMRKCWSQPAMAIFKNNRYWRSDIELRFQLNTNKFQTGSVMIGYMYNTSNDNSLSLRLNVNNLSQTNHCIIDASGSNLGTLYIPYKYINPYLNTDNTQDMCTIILCVLNDLDSPSTVYNHASITIYYRFINAKFMGTLDSTLVIKPQMLSLMRILGVAAEAGLHQVNKDLNRDKPPESSAPVPMAPRNASSWCVGTNLVEPTNLLRLDNCGQTPHPNIKLSSMLVNSISKIYGLLSYNVKWNTTDPTGHVLYKIDAAPVLKYSEYDSFELTWNIYPHADKVYALPPVSVLSTMFGFWRGTLDLKIDVVGTPFHKGQLLVSYIPHNHQMDVLKNNITIDMAKSSNYTICDLSETRSFSINIPYISNKHMYPVRDTNIETHIPPGYVNIFVLNPLIPMDNVTPYVYLNLYIRGGKDFELMVPIQPSIGLPYDPSFKPENNNILYTTESPPELRKATWLPYMYSVGPILYFSTNLRTYNNHIIPVDNLPIYCITFKDKPFNGDVPNFVLRLPTSYECVLIRDRPSVLFNYAALVERAPKFYSIVPIEKAFIDAFNVKYAPNQFNGLITKNQWVEYYNIPDGDDLGKNLLQTTKMQYYTNYVLKVDKITFNEPDWSFLEPQMDEREIDSNNVIPMSGSLTSTNSGLLTLGENFSDLKNLCRRYQKLFNMEILLNNSKTDIMSLRFAASPLGIVSNSEIDGMDIPEIFNRCRDGVIPLIASGFRFWRGSIRYRVMTDCKLDLNIIIQHRPDVLTSVYKVIKIYDTDKIESYLNHGYSMIIQNLSINNCVEFEVPWYNPNMLASSHPPYKQEFNNYCLGSVFIGFNNNVNYKKVGLSVYYSLGDDFRFDSFQGFPPMIRTYKTAIARPQMFETVKGWMNLPKEIKKINKTANEFRDEILPKIENSIKNDLDTKFINVYEILCELASQLVHCVINPTVKTVAWAIFSMFTKLGLLCQKAALKITHLCTKMFDLIPSGVKNYAQDVKNRYHNFRIGRRSLLRVNPDTKELFYGTKLLTPDLLKDTLAMRTLIENENTRDDEYKLAQNSTPICVDTSYRVHILPPETPAILEDYFDDMDEQEMRKQLNSKHGFTAQPQLGDNDVQIEECASSIVSIIYASICSLLSYKKDDKVSFKEYVPIYLKKLGDTASGANNIFRFIKNNFKVFKLMYEKVLYNKYWQLKRYRTIETECPELNQWANSVSILLQPRFRTFINNKQLWRDAVYGAARFGFLYLTDIGKEARRKTCLDPFIRSLYEKIVLLRDELQGQKLFPSLRQEAYSIWIHGPAGVGKSTLVDHLTSAMLKSIDFTHINELKYTISPVTKHWDGCNQQPVIVIDDAFAVNEPEANAQQLWAYFQICSPVPLRPPMARLEDKSMTYNPEIFVTCANTAFPQINMLRTEEALWRRRHLLVETRLNPLTTTSKDYPFGLTDKQVQNYEHIEFRIALDPRNKSTAYMGWMKFDQFTHYCIAMFKKFKTKSKATYALRHDLHYSLYPKDLEIPEESLIKSLYAKDNDQRANELGQVTDSFGCTLSDSVKVLEEVGTSVIQMTPSSSSASHPSIAEQQVKLALQSFKECSAPLTLSDVLKVGDIGDRVTDITIKPQMKEVQTLTDYLGVKDRQILLMNSNATSVPNAKQEFIDCCEAVLDTRRDEPEINIILDSCPDLKSFEDNFKHVKCPDSRDWADKRFVTMAKEDAQHAPYVNNQIKGNPLLPTIVNKNCLHKLIREDTPILLSDCKKYMFWLVDFQEYIFAVYDYPCTAENCIYKKDVNSIEYYTFCQYIYSWYSKNYDIVKCTLERFHLEGGVNFKFVENFLWKERIVTSMRRIVCHGVTRYKEIGLWKGFVLPASHWLGGWLTKIYGVLLTVVGMCGMLAIGFFTIRATCQAFQLARAPTTVPQLISSGDAGTHNRPNNTRLVVSKTISAKQQLKDHCLASVIRKRINSNTMYIEFTDNNSNRQAIMKCLIIKGRNLLVIKHYYDYLSTYTNEHSTCYLCWNDVGRIPFKFEDFEWRWFNDSNFGLIELPRTVSERKSLIQFIATEHQANTNLSPECEIVDVSPDIMKFFNETVSFCGTVCITPSAYSEELVMNGSWRYKRNYPGMCGSLLLSKNLSNPIIGMHVAGGAGFGYSEPLTREMFAELEGNIDGPIQEYRELDVPTIPVEERKIFLNGSHRYLGNIDADAEPGDIKLAKVESGVTKIVPSLLHGVYPILSEPSPLSPKDSRLRKRFSPLVEGCEKMCNPTYNFNAIDIAESENDLFEKLLTCVKPMRMNVHPLAVSQSLNGIPDLDGYEHINWDTSEGFPLSRIRPPTARNKRWLFKFNEANQAVGIHPSLQTIMDQKMKDRENGIVPVTLHDDCLKDARIPIDKINTPGKTRVFSISPVDFTIQFRQYYLDFIAAYCKARFSAEHAIGINVHGLEWTDLANLVGSDHMITGDYSGFGPTLNTEILHAVFRIIFKWYKEHNCREEDHKIRYVMSREIINARHLMNDYVYQTCCGMPSGNPATVVINSLVNSMYIRCAYLKIMRRTLYSGLYCFSKYVTLVTYGDDLIAKLHLNIVDDFNFNSLSLFFHSVNIKFTDAAKTGIAVEPTINLKTATFLKHCFNPHPTRSGVYLAGLDKASITECVNWVRVAPDMKDATYQNCVQATMLAYGWGPDYFNDLVNTIRVAWRKEFDEPFVCRTWKELDVLFLDENWDPNLKW